MYVHHTHTLSSLTTVSPILSVANGVSLGGVILNSVSTPPLVVVVGNGLTLTASSSEVTRLSLGVGSDPTHASRPYDIYVYMYSLEKLRRNLRSHQQ